MTDWGIKVSKEGFNVRTTDPKNLIFDSTKNQLKVARVLSSNFATTGSDQTITIAHNMPYIPGFLPFVKIGTRWYGNTGEDPDNGFLWVFSSDTSNIYFRLIDPGATVQTIYLKIYVLVDGASDVTSDTNSTNNYGIEVSQPGFEVKNSTDQILSLSTGFPQALQIASLVSINQTTVATDVSQAHNLGYAPAWLGVVVDNLGTFISSSLIPYLVIGNLELMAWSDSTNITTRVEAIAAVDFTFYIALLTADLEE